jgi:hypothetical protein
MTRLQFVKAHRKEIDTCLKKYLPDLKRPNDDDRWNWIFKVIPSKSCMIGITCNNACKIAKDIKKENK